ncbi:MAG TPA: ribonuclease D [Gammaproteobacteria bacterium]|nr:ribonuclease D [Gammaproteobacteria bacterium]
MGEQAGNPAVELIDTPDALKRFCASLRGAEWLALDTEFIRETTYYPQLCLIQVAVPGQAACIDPMRIDDLSALEAMLYDRATIKVMHSCSQDMEVMMNRFGRVPGPVFDTQLAAPLLGHPEQLGYAKLVKALLDVDLDKSQTRTDWSQRPLEPAQLRYAADDVIYLAQLYPLLRERLEQRGRLEWLEPEFSALEDPARYQPAPEDAWRRVKGLDRLRPAALAVAQALAVWREHRARADNVPRGWLFKDDVLLDLARLAPRDTGRLEKIRGLSARTRGRYGRAIVEQIREAGGREPQPLPARVLRDKASHLEEAALDLLQARLRLVGDSCGLNPALLGSRRQLLALLRGERELPLLQGWRGRLAGAALIALLEGREALYIGGGAARLRRFED